MSFDVNKLNISVYTALNVASITGAVSGKTIGIYHVKAKQGATYPYINYFAVIDVQGDTFTEYGNDTLIQIDVYSDSNSAAEAGEIVEAIAAQMDDKALSITGYNDALAIRENSRLLYEDEVNVFHYILEYSVRWGKSI